MRVAREERQFQYLALRPPGRPLGKLVAGMLGLFILSACNRIEISPYVAGADAGEGEPLPGLIAQAEEGQSAAQFELANFYAGDAVAPSEGTEIGKNEGLRDLSHAIEWYAMGCRWRSLIMMHHRARESIVFSTLTALSSSK